MLKIRNSCSFVYLNLQEIKKIGHCKHQHAYLENMFWNNYRIICKNTRTVFKNWHMNQHFLLFVAEPCLFIFIFQWNTFYCNRPDKVLFKNFSNFNSLFLLCKSFWKIVLFYRRVKIETPGCNKNITWTTTSIKPATSTAISAHSLNLNLQNSPTIFT